MTSYQDEYTRWHDKPTDGIDYSSNNGWIYTAYAKYLAPKTYDKDRLKICYDKCLKKTRPLKIDRSPEDPTPPISKDEIIGLASLGFLSGYDLKNSYWNFCNLDEYTQKKITLKKTVQALIGFIDIFFKTRKLEGGEKRNYFWKNKRIEVYPFAFRLSWANRYYVNKMSNVRNNPFYFVAFWFQVLYDITLGDRSVKMMNWLKLKDIGSPIADLLPLKGYLDKNFGKDHPFIKRS